MPVFEINFRPSITQLNKKFSNIDIRNFITNMIRELSLRVEREAKQETPADQGVLKASIRTSLQPLGAVIRPHVPYASWIHEGKMRRGGRTVYLKGLGRAGTPPGGKPYMSIGADKGIEQFNDKMARDLEAEIQAKIR